MKKYRTERIRNGDGLKNRGNKDRSREVARSRSRARRGGEETGARVEGEGVDERNDATLQYCRTEYAIKYKVGSEVGEYISNSIQNKVEISEKIQLCY